MYWRIPGYLSAADLNGVTTVLSEQLASGALPLEEEEEGVGLQEDGAGREDCTEQVTPALPTLDPEPGDNLDDMKGAYVGTYLATCSKMVTIEMLSLVI